MDGQLILLGVSDPHVFEEMVRIGRFLKLLPLSYPPGELNLAFIEKTLTDSRRIAVVTWLQDMPRSVPPDSGARETYAWGWLAPMLFNGAKGPRMVRLIYEKLPPGWKTIDQSLPMLRNNLPQAGNPDHPIAGSDKIIEVAEDLTAFFLDE